MPIRIEERVPEPGPIRRYWFDDDAFKTTCANSLSVPVPEGERFVIRTVKEAYPRITDAEIRAATDILLHEEDAHSLVHDAYNALLKRQGYPIAPFVVFSEKLYSFLNSHTGLKTRLAVCLSAEYLTALTSQHILESDPFAGTDTDPRMRRIWAWHCLEELDHRGTAYDIYLHLGGGFLLRTATMITMSVVYFMSHALCLGSMLKHEQALTGTKPRDTDGFLFGKNGFYPAVFKGWILFFKPGFHPAKDVRIPADMKETLHHYHIEGDIVGTLERGA